MRYDPLRLVVLPSFAESLLHAALGCGILKSRKCANSENLPFLQEKVRIPHPKAAGSSDSANEGKTTSLSGSYLKGTLSTYSISAYTSRVQDVFRLAATKLEKTRALTDRIFTLTCLKVI